MGGGEGGTQETRNPLEKKDDLGPWWRRRLREGPGTPMGGSQEGPLGGELKGERVVALPSAVTRQPLLSPCWSSRQHPCVLISSGGLARPRDTHARQRACTRAHTPPTPLKHAPSLTPTRGSDGELCDGAARVGPVRPRWLKASLLDRVSAKQPYTGRPTQSPKPASKQLHFTGTKLSRKQTRAPLCLSPHYSPEPRSGSHLKVH